MRASRPYVFGIRVGVSTTGTGDPAGTGVAATVSIEGMAVVLVAGGVTVCEAWMGGAGAGPAFVSGEIQPVERIRTEQMSMQRQGTRYLFIDPDSYRQMVKMIGSAR